MVADHSFCLMYSALMCIFCKYSANITVIRCRDFFMVLVVGGRLHVRTILLFYFREALARVKLMTKIVSSLFFLPYA